MTYYATHLLTEDVYPTIYKIHYGALAKLLTYYIPLMAWYLTA